MLRPYAKPIGRFSPERLFRPEAVAVVGAASAEGVQVMRNLLAGSFKGAILPVEASRSAVSGVLAYPEVSALPVVPDLAVIATEATGVQPAVEALAAKGTFTAIVLNAADGLERLSEKTGVRMLGPGSFGLVVPGLGLNASRSHLAPRKGRLALVSQSAGLCRAIIDWAEPNGVGFSHIVGVGGNEDLGFGQALDWLSRDAGTGVILLDIRTIKRHRAFVSAARAAARLRPVVAIRAGGRLLDQSGYADMALEAALRRSGIVSVTRFDDLLAAAETLPRARPVRTEAPTIVTNAIAPGQMAADAVLRAGLSLAALSAETRDALRNSLPKHTDTPSPEDTVSPRVTEDFVYVGLDQPAHLAEIANTLAGVREVGGVLVVHAPTDAGDTAAIEALGASARNANVPLLVCALGETTGAAHRRALADAGVPAFDAPEQMVRSFLYLVQHRRNRAAARELPPSTVLTVAPDREPVQRLFRRLRLSHRRKLTAQEASSVVSCYGIPTVPTRWAATPEDAAVAASLLGFPVVVKRRRVQRPDSGEKGGLVLGLQDAASVRMAAQSLATRAPDTEVAERESDEREPGCLVQRQVARSRELLIRVGDDAAFGPTILFGQGGTTADIVRDFAMDLPPLNLPLACALVARTRVAATLGPLRDMPAANVEAVAETLVRVSQLIVDFPEIVELDLNPLFVDEAGVAVADAWMELREPDEPGLGLAISPYPDHLVERWWAGGEAFTIRPIRPEDAEQHAAMFRRLSPDDIRFRFFSAIGEMSPEQTARMTQVDYDREMALVAIREATGEMVGVARLASDLDGKSGEFAVIVQPDMKGSGLARRLMDRLLAWARDCGKTTVTGQVLSDNTRMLAFVRRLGFELHRIPGEEDVVEATLSLGQPATAQPSAAN